MDSIETNSNAPIRAASAASTQSNRGKAFLALTAAMLWPGVGHLLAGRKYWGLAWFMIGTCLIAATVDGLLDTRFLPWIMVLAPATIAFYLFQLIDSIHAVRRAPSPMFHEPALRYFMGLIFAGVAIYGDHRAQIYLQDNWYGLASAQTASMAPTLAPGDFFLTIKNQPIKRWDIVSLTAPQGVPNEPRNMVKRVVGLPGETVEITGTALLINGKPVPLPAGVGPYVPTDKYLDVLTAPDPLLAGNGCWGRPITLDKNEYFVLGDDTTRSEDARVWPADGPHTPGALPAYEIDGVVIGRVWPLERWHILGTEPDGKPVTLIPR